MTPEQYEVERQHRIHYARVLLNEARARRRKGLHPRFVDTLLSWAANARRAAYELQQRKPAPLPVQGALF